ncbi:MAG TPA: MarR family transcriptional regulator [Nitrosopumilaceae archaeon]|nr:MarR family transcriptional regulator [Nitrosopumilaceae archaeon]
MDLRKNLDFNNSIGLLVKIAGKSFEKALDLELRDKCGLTVGQWKVIMALSFHDGQSQKEIANQVSVDGSTLVPIIDKMESEGFVQRKPNPEDRRNNNVFLTKKSKSLLDSIIQVILDVRKIITTQIPEKDLDITKAVLKKMTYNADLFIEQKSGKPNFETSSPRQKRGKIKNG